ncbi:MAG: hypothetical protein R2851_07715 [Caldilineaceae bacterium]
MGASRALRKAWRKTTRLRGMPLMMAVRMYAVSITSTMLARVMRAT